MKYYCLLLLCLLGHGIVAQTNYVFLNGKIYTADSNQSFVEALAIEGNTIIYTGNNSGVEAFIDAGTIVTDLEGKVILPGLHDVHIHILEASSEANASCFLDPWEYDIWALGQSLSDCNVQANSNGWIFAWGHSIFTMLDATEPPKNILDFYFPDVPVVVMEETSHSAWVNSTALEWLNIDETTEDPIGGHIVMEGGEPNGLLLDSAGDMAFAAALASNEEIDQSNYDGMVNFGFPSLREFGITSIVEGRTYWKREYIETWHQLKEDGELTCRTVLALWAHPEDLDEELIANLIDLYDEGDDMLRTTQVKMYIDGLTLAGTAALDQDYVYAFGWPFTNGFNYFTPERMEDYITQLELIGYDFFIHAIGNRGVKEALDAIEGARNTNGDVGARHRLTHLEVVNAEEYPRFAELDVIADAQVSGNWTNPNQWNQNNWLIGPVLSDNMIPIKSIFDTGGLITLSSDWDVSTMNPFRSIQNAVTRAPQNLPSVEEAVDARTIHSAFCMRHEDITGSIEVGKRADIICIDQDIFSIPQNQIAQTEVTLTLLDGEIIYQNDAFPISINDEETPLFKIAPTITSDYITLYSEQSGGEFIVIDVAGKVVKSGMVTSLNQLLNCDDLPEGLYTLIIVNEDLKLSEKFVISR